MNNSAKTKNDIAWERLFEKHRILEAVEKDGQTFISSEDINVFREARLMTKFDHSKNLPILFQNEQLTILPVTRGEYIIARMQAYQPIDVIKNSSVVYMDFPPYIESVEYSTISSEAAAINCAYISGIFEHFLEDEVLLPTVSGRMSSGTFTFSILNMKDESRLKVNVNKSQVEIDGGYEGIHSFSLIEAKLSLSSDFLVRQLYYPYRLWQDKVSKEVRTIFLIYSNGLFHLYQYRFQDPKLYNSLELVKYTCYSLERRDINLEDIQQVLRATKTINEPRIPFPQADSFERIINLCELLYEADALSREDVTTTYDFDVRQTNYYTDAGRYLGLIDKEFDDGVKYFLTEEGRLLIEKKYRERQLGFARAILQHRAFSKVLQLYLDKGEPPTRNEIVSIMRVSGLYNVEAETTFRRRASTIISWINWILSLTNL